MFLNTHTFPSMLFFCLRFSTYLRHQVQCVAASEIISEKEKVCTSVCPMLTRFNNIQTRHPFQFPTNLSSLHFGVAFISRFCRFVFPCLHVCISIATPFLIRSLLFVFFSVSFEKYHNENVPEYAKFTSALSSHLIHVLFILFNSLMSCPFLLQLIAFVIVATAATVNANAVAQRRSGFANNFILFHSAYLSSFKLPRFSS